MAPVKRRPHTRSQHKMKLRRHRPNTSELVYKFLCLHAGKQAKGEDSRGWDTGRCRVCKRQKRGEQVLDSLNSRIDGSMANKRKDSARSSKIHRVKRRQTTRNKTLSSCMHRTNGGEGLKQMKKYIQKALDFGVESGYLIPKDATYKVLRVSSDLMADVNYANKLRKSDSTVSQIRNRGGRRTPIRFEDYEVQDARRRRSGRRRSRRRRRSRSASRRRRRRSRRRGRRRSGSATGEEVIDVENDAEYALEDQPEKRSNPESANRNEDNEQSNQLDREKEVEKREDDASDLSIDEDESEDEDEKKIDDTNKS